MERRQDQAALIVRYATGPILALAAMAWWTRGADRDSLTLAAIAAIAACLIGFTASHALGRMMGDDPRAPTPSPAQELTALAPVILCSLLAIVWLDSLLPAIAAVSAAAGARTSVRQDRYGRAPRGY